MAQGLQSALCPRQVNPSPLLLWFHHREGETEARHRETPPNLRNALRCREHRNPGQRLSPHGEGCSITILIYTRRNKAPSHRWARRLPKLQVSGGFGSPWLPSPQRGPAADRHPRRNFERVFFPSSKHHKFPISPRAGRFKSNTILHLFNLNTISHPFNFNTILHL